MADRTVPIVTIDGQHFYADGRRFIARGVVYQPHGYGLGSGLRSARERGGLDPLVDASYLRLCNDVVALKDLNVNALWIYCHDPRQGHDKCMDLLAANGIYVIFEASARYHSLHWSLTKNDLDSSILGRYAKVIDSVSQYNNTLGVCVANQVISKQTFSTIKNAESSWNSLGSLVKQMKQYMRFKNGDTGQRILPLCINDGQWSSLNTTTFQYIAGSKADFGPIRPAGGRVDFYCFVHYHASERYRHLDADNMPTTVLEQYEEKVGAGVIELASGTASCDAVTWANHIPMKKFVDDPDPVPIMISEYGTNARQPRPFDEVTQLYGKDLDSPLLQRLSGGFLYEFNENATKFGLVGRRSDESLELLPDYESFREKMLAAVGKPGPHRHPIGAMT